MTMMMMLLLVVVVVTEQGDVYLDGAPTHYY